MKKSDVTAPRPKLSEGARWEAASPPEPSRARFYWDVY